MRQAARQAWIRRDNSSRLRRAMLSQQRPEAGPWFPGEQVYFGKRSGRSNQKQLKARARADPDRWVGPAVVLSVSGSVAWLSYHRQLL